MIGWIHPPFSVCILLRHPPFSVCILLRHPPFSVCILLRHPAFSHIAATHCVFLHFLKKFGENETMLQTFSLVNICRTRCSCTHACSTLGTACIHYFFKTTNAQESSRLYNEAQAADFKNFKGDIKTKEFNSAVGAGLKITAWVGAGTHHPSSVSVGDKVRLLNCLQACSCTHES